MPPKASFARLLAYTVMLSLGPGSLALSRAAVDVGVVVTFLATMFTGLALAWSMLAFIRVKDALDPIRKIVTYQDLGSQFASSGRAVAEAGVVGFQFLVLCVYAVLIGQIIGVYSLSNGIWLALAFVPLCVACCVQHLRDLGAVAQLTAVSYVALWLATLTYCAARLFRGSSVGARAHNTSVLPTAGWTKPVHLYETLLYAFEGLPAALPQVVDTLVDRTRAADLVSRSVVIVTAVYVVTEYAGLFAFRRPRASLTYNLLDTLGEDALLPMSVNLVLVLTVFLKFPLQLFPMISILERKLGIGPGGQLDDDDTDDDLDDNAHKEKKEQEPLLPNSAAGRSRSAVFVDARDSGECLRVVLLRSTVVAATLLVALLVDDLGFLIQVAGAVFAPLLAFILPLTAELVLIDTGDIRRTHPERLVSAALLVVATVLAILSAVAIVYDAVVTDAAR
mmetsp:Transcript_24920/g.80651  ORF Transcript_24920/g.80651 Transcript_24920/m.80651 type:complete len:450 (+) Transcript_24920:1036-2385(+)